METITLSVPGISCSHCEHAINGALTALPGINDSSVDLTARTVTVTYDKSKTALDAIKAAIEEQGYDVA